MKCHYQLLEWSHATHIWKHDIGAQHLPPKSKHKSMEKQELDEVCLISLGARKHSAHKLQEELMKNNEVFDGESSVSVNPLAPLIPPAPPEGRVLKTKGQKLKSAAAHLTADMEGLLLFDPP